MENSQIENSLGNKQVKKTLQEVLAHSDSIESIPQWNPQELFFLVSEIGLSESGELLQYCSTEQILLCMDLACWEKDKLLPQKMLAWLQTLLEMNTAKFSLVIRELEDELLSVFLSHYIRVYDLSFESPPEEPIGHFYVSPDRFYVVDIIDLEQSSLIERMLEALYKEELQLGYKTLMSVKWSIGAETEEKAYQLHSARLAELGYLDPQEAIKIYQVIDINSVKIGEGTGPNFSESYFSFSDQIFLPNEWVEEMKKVTFLNKVIGSLSSRDKKVLSHYLLFLLNRALSSEYLTLGRMNETKSVVESTLGYLSIGLEYICGAMLKTQFLVSDSNSSKEIKFLENESIRFLSKGIEALQTISLQRIFQVGYTLVSQLRKIAKLLVDQGFTTLEYPYDLVSLLDTPSNEVIRLILTKNRRLLYYCGLDEVPQDNARAFRECKDIYRTTKVLEKIGILIQFLSVGLGLQQAQVKRSSSNCYQTISDIRLAHVLGTVICNFCLDRPMAFVPVLKEDLPRLRKSWPLIIQEQKIFYEKVVKKLFERVQERSISKEEENIFWSEVVQNFIKNTFEEISLSLEVISQEKDVIMLAGISGFLIRKN